MSNALNKITTRAKQLRKANKKLTWMQAVKKSSAEYRAKNKPKKSAIKKRVVKRAAKKRVIKKRVIKKRVASSTRSFKNFVVGKRTRRTSADIAQTLKREALHDIGVNNGAIAAHTRTIARVTGELKKPEVRKDKALAKVYRMEIKDSKHSIALYKKMNAVHKRKL